MPIEIPSDVHPELVPLFWLIGQWQGEGMVSAADRDYAITQRMSFSAPAGQPYLLYTCETFLADFEQVAVPQGSCSRVNPLPEEPNAVTGPKAQEEPAPYVGVETGIWQLGRARDATDSGPGLQLPSETSRFPGAEAVERLRDDHGFPVQVSLVHPHGLLELYTGRVNSARIDVATEGLLRADTAKAYRAGRRMYGLVQGDLLWAWDMATGSAELQSHASARLSKV